MAKKYRKERNLEKEKDSYLPVDRYNLCSFTTFYLQQRRSDPISFKIFPRREAAHFALFSTHDTRSCGSYWKHIPRIDPLFAEFACVFLRILKEKMRMYTRQILLGSAEDIFKKFKKKRQGNIVQTFTKIIRHTASERILKASLRRVGMVPTKDHVDPETFSVSITSKSSEVPFVCITVNYSHDS